MLDVSLYDVKDSLINNLIRITIVYPMTRKSHFRLLQEICVTLSNKDVIIIPAGFQFDGSSAPRFLWWAMPSYGDFFIGALIHDYLYQTQYKHTELGYKEAQKFADKEMLEWSNAVNNKNIGKIIDNYLRYLAVRLFGKKVFRK